MAACHADHDGVWWILLNESHKGGGIVNIVKHLSLRFALALAVVCAGCLSARAGSEVGPCQLTIKGHSIRQLTLISKATSAGVRLESPGQTVALPMGEYRVEQVELEDGFSLKPVPGQRSQWFQVTHEGPNELVVGGPLYPTVGARRHGGFIQMDYATVDGAGREYQRVANSPTGRAPAPTFTVYQGAKQIGAGSFEYG